MHDGDPKEPRAVPEMQPLRRMIVADIYVVETDESDEGTLSRLGFGHGWIRFSARDDGDLSAALLSGLHDR